VVMVIDASGVPSLYFDDSFVGSYAGTGPISPSNVTRIGGYPEVITRCVDALIDEVRIYNRALSAAEIAAIYNATK